MRLLFAMFMAYLIGSIPTGHLFAKFKNVDLRRVGSGNVGATNVLRTVGKVAAFFTLLFDILKGYIAVTFLADMTYSFRMGVDYPEYLAILGLCVIIGHNWPIFLDFKGGKGVATSAGVLLRLCPKLVLLGLCIWILVFIFTKIVSLASLITAISLPVVSYFCGYEGSLKILIFILAVLLVIRHKANIQRLIKKEEHKVFVKSSKS